jgi:hypothetical protein
MRAIDRVKILTKTTDVSMARIRSHAVGLSKQQTNRHSKQNVPAKH